MRVEIYLGKIKRLPKQDLMVIWNVSLLGWSISMSARVCASRRSKSTMLVATHPLAHTRTEHVCFLTKFKLFWLAQISKQATGGGPSKTRYRAAALIKSCHKNQVFARIGRSALFDDIVYLHQVLGEGREREKKKEDRS